MFVISLINPFTIFDGDSVHRSTVLVVEGENADSVNVIGVVYGNNPVRLNKTVTVVIPPANTALVQTDAEMPEWFLEGKNGS